MSSTGHSITVGMNTSGFTRGANRVSKKLEQLSKDASNFASSVANLNSTLNDIGKSVDFSKNVDLIFKKLGAMFGKANTLAMNNTKKMGELMSNIRIDPSKLNNSVAVCLGAISGFVFMATQKLKKLQGAIDLTAFANRLRAIAGIFDSEFSNIQTKLSDHLTAIRTLFENIFDSSILSVVKSFCDQISASTNATATNVKNDFESIKQSISLLNKLKENLSAKNVSSISATSKNSDKEVKAIEEGAKKEKAAIKKASEEKKKISEMTELELIEHQLNKAKSKKKPSAEITEPTPAKTARSTKKPALDKELADSSKVSGALQGESQNIKGYVDSIRSTIESAHTIFNNFANGFDGNVTKVTTGIDAMFGPIENMGPRLNAIVALSSEMRSAFEVVTQTVKEFAANIKQSFTEVDTALKEIVSVGTRTKSLSTAVKNAYNDATDKTETSVKNIIDQIDKLTESTKRFADVAPKIEAAVANINNGVSAIKITKAQSEKITSYVRQLKKMAEAATQLATASSSLRGMKDFSFSDSLVGKMQVTSDKTDFLSITSKKVTDTVNLVAAGLSDIASVFESAAQRMDSTISKIEGKLAGITWYIEQFVNSMNTAEAPIKSAAEAVESMTKRLKTALDDLKAGFSEINDVVSKSKQISTATKNIYNKNVGNIAPTKDMGDQSKQIDALATALSKLSTAADAFQGKGKSVTSLLKQIKVPRSMLRNIQELTATLKTMNAAISGIKGVAEGTQSAFKGFGFGSATARNIKDISAAVDGYLAAVKKIEPLSEKTENAFNKIGTSLHDNSVKVSTAALSMGNSINRVAGRLSMLGLQLKRATENFTTFRSACDGSAQMDTLSGSVKKLRLEITGLKNEADEAAEKLTNVKSASVGGFGGGGGKNNKNGGYRRSNSDGWLGGKSSSEFSSASRAVIVFNQALQAVDTLLSRLNIYPGQIAKGFLDAGKKVEDLRTRMLVLTGSTKIASQLVQEMGIFAAKVPFEYENILESSTRLVGVLDTDKPVQDTKKWMAMITDLAAVSGLSVEETTSQVIRMYSAGAQAADMFRERGISAMLGFRANTKYTATETRKMLEDAWQSSDSKFRDASRLLANNLSGIFSMIADKYFLFQNKIMENGPMLTIKSIVGGYSFWLDAAQKDVDSFAVRAGEKISELFDNINRWAINTAVGIKASFGNINFAINSIKNSVGEVLWDTGGEALKVGSLVWLINGFTKSHPFLAAITTLVMILDRLGKELKEIEKVGIDDWVDKINKEDKKRGLTIDPGTLWTSTIATGMKAANDISQNGILQAAQDHQRGTVSDYFNPDVSWYDTLNPYKNVLAVLATPIAALKDANDSINDMRTMFNDTLSLLKDDIIQSNGNFSSIFTDQADIIANAGLSVSSSATTYSSLLTGAIDAGAFSMFNALNGQKVAITDGVSGLGMVFGNGSYLLVSSIADMYNKAYLEMVNGGGRLASELLQQKANMAGISANMMAASNTSQDEAKDRQGLDSFNKLKGFSLAVLNGGTNGVSVGNIDAQYDAYKNELDAKIKRRKKTENELRALINSNNTEEAPLEALTYQLENDRLAERAAAATLEAYKNERAKTKKSGENTGQDKKTQNKIESLLSKFKKMQNKAEIELGQVGQPELEQKLYANLEKAKDLFEELEDLGASDAIKSEVGSIINSIKDLGEKKIFAEADKQWEETFKGLEYDLAAAKLSAEQTGEAFELDLQRKLDELAISFKLSGDQAGRYNDEIEKFAVLSRQIRTATINTQMNQTNKDLTREISKIGKSEDQIRELELQYKLQDTVTKEWKAQNPILANQIEELIKLADRLTQVVDFKDGINAAFVEVQNSYQTFGEATATFMTDVFSGLSSSLENCFFDIFKGNLDDAAKAMESFADSIMQSIAQIMSNRIATQLMSGVLGMFGGGSTSMPSSGGGEFTSWLNTYKFHSGGIVSGSHNSRMRVNAALFNGAPRFHNGLMSDEFPAILQRGEVVIPKNGFKTQPTKSQNVTVNIKNESGDTLKVTKAASSGDMSQTIIDVVVDGIARNRSGLRDMLGSR